MLAGRRTKGGGKNNVKMELSKTYSKNVNWFGFAVGCVLTGGDALLLVKEVVSSQSSN